MPLYEYECPQCRTRFEEPKSFIQSDDPAFCPDCPEVAGIKILGMPMVLSTNSGVSESSEAMIDPRVNPGRRKWGHMPGCPCCRRNQL